MKPATRECDSAIAALISCTKRKKRPLTLTQIAKELNTAIACFGSIDAVSDKIDLSPGMIRRFLCVDRLHPKLAKLVDNRVLDSIDAVAELSSLDFSRQESVADVLNDRDFNTEDIRGLVRLLNRYPSLGIDEILAKVLASKTVRVFVYEFVARESSRRPEEVKDRLLTLLKPEEIIGLEIGPVTGRVRVSKSGRLAISCAAKATGMTISRFVQRLCEGTLQDERPA